MDSNEASKSTGEIQQDTDDDEFDQHPTPENGAGNVIPKKGFVNQVCKEWLVHEDSALAYRLQKKEIEMHYGRNRQDRQTVMLDIQRAKTLQEQDDLDSAITVNQYLHLQELEDEKMAKQLQAQMECEEVLHNRIVVQADQEMAKKLQDNEKSHHPKAKRSGNSLPGKMDLASCYEDTLARATKNWSLDNSVSRKHTGHTPVDILQEAECDRFQDLAASSNPCSPADDDLQRLQELKDEELALTLHREESQKTTQYYKDQQLAIEYQDRELAKLLQEKERLRAKKLRQKHKLASQNSRSPEDVDESHKGMEGDKIESKHSMQSSALLKQRDLCTRGIKEDAYFTTVGAHAESPVKHSIRPLANSDRSQSYSLQRQEETHFERFRAERPTASKSLDSGQCYQTAMVDLNSPREKLSLQLPNDSHNTTSPVNDDSSDEYSDEPRVPPYMPIQGQKRQSSDKKRKKDGCRQQ